MQNILPTRRAFAAFMIGWSCLYLLLVITTTQFHISELTMLGLNIPFAERIAMTMADIMGGLPLIGIIFGVGYFLAMITANIVTRFFKPMPDIVYAVAGGVCVATILHSLRAVTGITPLPVARGMDGFVALCIIGALSGFVFSRLKRLMQT